MKLYIEGRCEDVIWIHLVPNKDQ